MTRIYLGNNKSAKVNTVPLAGDRHIVTVATIRVPRLTLFPLQVIVTSFSDSFPRWIKKYLRHHELLVLLVCLFCLLLGLPYLFQVN